MHKTITKTVYDLLVFGNTVDTIILIIWHAFSVGMVRMVTFSFRNVQVKGCLVYDIFIQKHPIILYLNIYSFKLCSKDVIVSSTLQLSTIIQINNAHIE